MTLEIVTLILTKVINCINCKMKNLLKTAFYKILKKCQENKVLNTVIQFTYLNVLSKFYGKPQVKVNFDNNKIRIAFICDEMTWCDFNNGSVTTNG